RTREWAGRDWVLQADISRRRTAAGVEGDWYERVCRFDVHPTRADTLHGRGEPTTGVLVLNHAVQLRCCGHQRVCHPASWRIVGRGRTSWPCSSHLWPDWAWRRGGDAYSR